MITTIFWNGHEHRVRALWRQILQFVVFFAVLTVFLTILGALLAPLKGTYNSRSSILVSILAHVPFGEVVSAATVLLSIWLMARFINREPFALFGFRFTRNWWIDCAFGLLLGLTLTTLVFLVELVAGWVTITGTFASGIPGLPFALAILIPLVLFIGAAFFEESLFRGYPIRNLAQGITGRRISPTVAMVLLLLLSSLPFGWIHHGNPHAVVLGVINIGLAGVLFGLGYLLTGNLGLSIGLHIAWDFTQGCVFGSPVAGQTLGVSLMTVARHGPALWTGGAFGPDGGLLVTLAFVLGLLPVLLYIRLRYGQTRLYAPLAAYTPRIGAVSAERETVARPVARPSVS